MNPPDAQRPLILVYQMGKVASVAVEKGLQQALPDVDVRRLHITSEPRLAYFIELLEHARDAGDVPFGAMTSIVDQVRFGSETREYVEEQLAAGRRITVVTGVREPVDFAVASFFQVLAFVSPLAADLHRLDPAWVATLQAAFLDFWTRATAGAERTSSADRQICPLFTMPQQLYRTFRETLHVPPGLLAAAYATRYARHFYTEGERAEFTARWSGRPRRDAREAQRAAC